MNRIEIQGVGLHLERIPGDPSKPPLVFLHEGLGSVAMWAQRGRHWPRELCTMTGRAGWLYDRRGYGQSDPVADVRGTPHIDGFWHLGRHEPDYMHREALDVLPLVLSTIGAQAPVLIGHSDGATIALLHAANHTVSGCVVMAPHVFVEEMTLQAIRQAREQFLDTSHPGHLRERLARYHRDVDNAFWQWNDVWLSEAFRAFDIRQVCTAIRSPILAIQGVDDPYGSLKQVEDIRAAAPQTRVETLQACGHSPHRDQPDDLLALVTDFLQDSVAR